MYNKECYIYQYNIIVLIFSTKRVRSMQSRFGKRIQIGKTIRRRELPKVKLVFRVIDGSRFYSRNVEPTLNRRISCLHSPRGRKLNRGYQLSCIYAARCEMLSCTHPRVPRNSRRLPLILKSRTVPYRRNAHPRGKPPAVTCIQLLLDNRTSFV